MSLVEKLRAGDAAVWEHAFPWLYPVAYEAARTRLGNANPIECEDIAIESLADFLQSGTQARNDEEIKPLIAAIARNKATDRIRRWLASKRGAGNVESLESLRESGGDEPSSQAHELVIDRLTMDDLRELLLALASQIKKEHRIVLGEHYLNQLSYEEIANKHQISVNSVGVYLKRGLEAMKSALARKPKLMNELVGLVGEGGMVRVLLPLAFAVELGRLLYDSGIRYQEESQLPVGAFRRDQDASPRDPLKDDRLRLVTARENLPAEAALSEKHRRRLLEQAAKKFPAQFEELHRRQEATRQQRELERNQKQKGCMGALLVALALIVLFVLMALH